MKKIFLILIILEFIFLNHANALSINFILGGGGQTIDGALGGTSLIQAGDMSVEHGVRDLLLRWSLKIGTVLSIAAVLSIVYGSFMMIISTGEEEKVKKAKNIVKWAIIGFLGVVLAGSIIAIVTEFMYQF